MAELSRASEFVGLGLDKGDMALIKEVSEKHLGRAEYANKIGDRIQYDSHVELGLVDAFSVSFLEGSIVISKVNDTAERNTIGGKRNYRADRYVVERVVGGNYDSSTGYWDNDVDWGEPHKFLRDALTEAVGINIGWELKRMETQYRLDEYYETTTTHHAR